MKIGDIIRKALAEGKDTKEILDLVKAAHPNAQTSAASVAWYRSQMKKQGDVPPKASKKTNVLADTVKAIITSKAGYTVGNFKATQGMEGPGFIVTLYRDGKPVAQAADYGDGGCVHWDWLDFTKPKVTVKCINYRDEPHEYKGTPEEALFWMHCLSLPKYVNKYDPQGREVYMTPDVYVEDLLNDMRMLKTTKAAMKTKVIVISGGQMWQYKVAPTAEGVAKVLESCKKKDPYAFALNGLSDDEVLKAINAIVTE